MATYDNLPVYKQTYDLLLQLFRVCQNMERDYKFTLGENLKKEIITLIINVYRANCRENKEKLPLLQSGRENVEVVRLLLRLLQDLKQIGLKEFVLANEKLESVSKQMAAWANSVSKPQAAPEINKGFNGGQSLEGLFAFQESAG
ncbi:hypothetical protein FACS189474_5700 [Bacteroidia bacterium]|nr:hypothetical protein FACS189440_20300 [Bacteroidia bacterium]GHT89239.1 hypothetical protein FACS189474_5700 [Bacteroidia bacterium]